MMTRTSIARKVIFPASFMGVKTEWPGGRKPAVPGDGACPINEKSA
jgi:hypothetical protein